jgi:hypothetical protein
LVPTFTTNQSRMQSNITQEEYYAEVVDLCIFMLHQISDRPENIVDEVVQWPRVIADVHLMYNGYFDNDMLVDAIVLINKASDYQLTGNLESLEVPEGSMIH